MFECNRLLYNVLLNLRCSVKTAKINLMVFLIHVVMRSGVKIEYEFGYSNRVLGALDNFLSHPYVSLFCVVNNKK